MPCARTRRSPLLAGLLRLSIAASMVTSVACASSPERLPPLTRQFYYNLPSQEDQQAFLKLKESQRQGFLEERGLWARWTALLAAERQAVENGELEPGFHEFAAFMAWGPPADTQPRGDTTYHTFIRCTSGPKAGRYVSSNLSCDGTSSEIEIAVSGDLVTEIKYLN